MNIMGPEIYMYWSNLPHYNPTAKKLSRHARVVELVKVSVVVVEKIK